MGIPHRAVLDLFLVPRLRHSPTLPDRGTGAPADEKAGTPEILVHDGRSCGSLDAARRRADDPDDRGVTHMNKKKDIAEGVQK